MNQFEKTFLKAIEFEISGLILSYLSLEERFQGGDLAGNPWGKFSNAEVLKAVAFSGASLVAEARQMLETLNMPEPAFVASARWKG